MILDPKLKKMALEALHKCLMTDECPTVRSQVVKELKYYGEEAIPYLSQALDEQQSPSIRLEIVTILGSFGNPLDKTSMKNIIIPLPEQKNMNPEMFLAQNNITPLIKALLPIFTRIYVEAGSRHDLLEIAGIDSLFMGNLRLEVRANIFTQNLVAELKRYPVSKLKYNNHPLVNLLLHLTDFADSNELSEDDLRLFDRLIKQGQENFKALIARNAVGRIESPQGTGIGTGVLVAKNLLLSCNHVFTKTRVNTAWVRFGYKSSNYVSENIFELDLNFIANCPHLDYALIRLQATPSLKHIAPVNATLDSRQKIRLIHHPLGKPVEISGLGEIVQVGEDYIDHNLNTDDGSSGAPIFNSCWELIAIHRGNPGVGRHTTGTMEGKPISAIWNLIANHLS